MSLVLLFPIVKGLEDPTFSVRKFSKHFTSLDVIPVAVSAGQFSHEELADIVKDFPQVHVLAIDELSTKAKVLNITLEQYPSDFIAVIPPGVEIDTGNLKDILDNFSDENLFAASPTIVSPDYLILSTGILFSRGLPKFADCGKPNTISRANQVHYFKGVTTECSIFRTSMIKELGGFDEEYLGGYEGLDLCLSAFEKGYKSLHDPVLVMKDHQFRYRYYEGKIIHDPDLEHFVDKHGGLEKLDRLNDCGEYYGSGQSMPSTELWQHEGGSKKGKIVCFLADHHGCGQYRVKNPYREMLKRGWDVMFTTYSPDNFIEWGDILIFQRQYADHMLEKIKIARTKGKKIIYDIDDYFHGLEMSNPVTPEFINNPRWLRNIERVIYQANALTVSTPELLKQYGKFNTNSYIIPNGIDLSMLPNLIKENPDPNIVRIGWAGSITHDEDMRQVVESVQNVMKKYINTKLIFIGADYRSYFQEIPNSRLEWFPGTSDHEDGVGDYYKALNDATLDIGISPITNSQFNRAKSFLKNLEYSAYGTPSVASDVEPYIIYSKLYPEYGKRTLLAKTPRDWERHLSSLIEDKNLRFELGNNGQRMVHNEMNMTVIVDQLEELCTRLMTEEGHVPRREEPSHSLPVSFLSGMTSAKAEEAHAKFVADLKAQELKEMVAVQ